MPKVAVAPKEYRFYDLLKVLSDEAGILSNLMGEGEVGVEGTVTVVPSETAAAIVVGVDAQALAGWVAGYLKGSLPAEVYAIIEELTVNLTDGSGLTRTVRLRRSTSAASERSGQEKDRSANVGYSEAVDAPGGGAAGVDEAEGGGDAARRV